MKRDILVMLQFYISDMYGDMNSDGDVTKQPRLLLSIRQL